MKKIFTFILLACSFHLMSNVFAKANEQALDQMVAVVNDDVITTSELNHALATAKMQLMQERAAIPADSVLKKQVLDQLINKKVQLQIAHAAGLQVTDKELNKAIDRIAKQNNMTPASMYEQINRDGMTTVEYRSEMRDQMTIQKLQQQEVASKINITPQELKNFIRSHTWQMSRTKEYHLEDILIPVKETPSSDELNAAKQHAVALIEKIKLGNNFEQIIQSENQQLQGGDLGWRPLTEIPSAFSEKVIHMKSNEIVGPIQTPNGYHIIRLLEVRFIKGNQSGPDRKALEEMLLQQKFEEAMHAWVTKLRGQAFIITNPTG